MVGAQNVALGIVYSNYTGNVDYKTIYLGPNGSSLMVRFNGDNPIQPIELLSYESDVKDLLKTDDFRQVDYTTGVLQLIESHAQAFEDNPLLAGIAEDCLAGLLNANSTQNPEMGGVESKTN